MYPVKSAVEICYFLCKPWNSISYKFHIRNIFYYLLFHSHMWQVNRRCTCIWQFCDFFSLVKENKKQTNNKQRNKKRMNVSIERSSFILGTNQEIYFRISAKRSLYSSFQYAKWICLFETGCPGRQCKQLMITVSLDLIIPEQNIVKQI